MSAREPPFGIITIICSGCRKMITFPFLDKRELVIPDLVRKITPRCRCGLPMKVEEITRAEGCGEKEEVTG